MNNYSTSLKYVGYIDQNDIAKSLFSQQTIDNVSNRISFLLKEELNIDMIVADNVIVGVLNQYFSNYVPYQTGDIYTKDVQSKVFVNELENLVNQAIYFIVSTIVLEKMQEYKNSQLSIWNDTRSKWFDHIKILKRRPNAFSWVPAGQLENNIPQMN